METGCDVSIARNILSSSKVRETFSTNRPDTDYSVENHINGENLMEMDQTHLKDMGIKKIGDRVRIGTQAKLFRNREYKRASKRSSNRVRQQS